MKRLSIIALYTLAIAAAMLTFALTKRSQNLEKGMVTVSNELFRFDKPLPVGIPCSYTITITNPTDRIARVVGLSKC
jgi:hypothetical protein